MSTAVHTLQLVAGPFRVAITEAPEAVYFGITGAKPLGFERRKVSAFIFPLVDRYRDDSRRMEVSGQHCDLTGHINPLGGNAWVGYQIRQEARQ